MTRRSNLAFRYRGAAFVLASLFVSTLWALPPALAAGSHTVHAALPAQPKQPLLDGSVDTRQCSAGSPALAYFQSRLYLAWTGCDASRHLNIESSTDGVTWGNKVTLTDTAKSGTGPALAVFHNHLYVVWAGTDSPSHMHIGYFQGNSALANHTWLADSTGYTPALAYYSANGLSYLYLAWTGTDSAHHLNFEDSADGITFTHKVTLTDTSARGPSLAVFNGRLYADWVGTDTPRHMWVGYYVRTSSLGGHARLPWVPTPDGDPALAAQGGNLFAAFTQSNSIVSISQSSDGLSWGTLNSVCYNDLGCTYLGVGLASDPLICVLPVQAWTGPLNQAGDIIVQC
jgi:hypothetical protein